MLEIEIANRLTTPYVEDARMRLAVCRILADANIQDAEISIAVVSDAEMHLLNQRHLQHDYPTDVLSFALSFEQLRLEGEIVVSYDTASRQAESYGWATEDELLLYVVHGMLHLVGHEDDTPERREQMRKREVRVMQHFHITPHYNITPHYGNGKCSHTPAGGKVE